MPWHRYGLLAWTKLWSSYSESIRREMTKASKVHYVITACCLVWCQYSEPTGLQLVICSRADFNRLNTYAERATYQISRTLMNILPYLPTYLPTILENEITHRNSHTTVFWRCSPSLKIYAIHPKPLLRQGPHTRVHKRHCALLPFEWTRQHYFQHF
jgi:hypothetical protein